MTDNKIAKFNQQYLQAFKQLANLSNDIKRLKDEEKEVKKVLEEEMGKYGIEKIENEYINVTWVEPNESISIDLKELEKKEPETYHSLIRDFPKVRKRKGYLRFTTK